MKGCQQGFALAESMAGVVVFAILLIALLNYTQYITLNFNQIYQGATAIRVLHNTQEAKASSIEITTINSEISSLNWQKNEVYLQGLDGCTESTVSLSTGKQQFSLSRWFCKTGERHVSGLSF